MSLASTHHVPSQSTDVTKTSKRCKLHYLTFLMGRRWLVSATVRRFLVIEDGLLHWSTLLLERVPGLSIMTT